MGYLENLKEERSHYQRSIGVFRPKVEWLDAEIKRVSGDLSNLKNERSKYAKTVATFQRKVDWLDGEIERIEHEGEQAAEPAATQ